MDALELNEEEIKKILKEARVIAIVGCSRNPKKAAFKIPRYLQTIGYRIIPVNPYIDEILGEKSYKNLLEIPEEIKVDVVNIFRPTDDVPAIIDQTIKKGIKVVWMQLGIRNEKAAHKGTNAGLSIIQDSCIMVEHTVLLG